jgi:hypothetical protein
VHAEDYRAHAAQFMAAVGFVSVTREPSPAPPRTKADRLADLARLHAEEVMTDAEYEAARRRLLDST